MFVGATAIVVWVARHTAVGPVIWVVDVDRLQGIHAGDALAALAAYGGATIILGVAAAVAMRRGRR